MNETLEFLARYGTLALFGIVFIEQLGAPLPAPPFLLAAGVLAGSGRINGAVAVAGAALGSLLADVIWFFLARAYGHRMLSFLCRISLEPDSCVRRTTDMFSRYGMRVVMMGKFVPGLSTVMPPLAGIFGVSLPRFVAFDGLGSFLYVGCYLGLGFVFSHQLEPALEALGQLGHGALVLVVGLLAAYIGYKYVQRQRVLRELRLARMTVEELRRRLDGGEEMFIIDLRSELDVKSDPYRIPGARHWRAQEMEKRHQEIPRDREVVLYCSCPNEASAARAGMTLYRRGITRVHPLLGGIDAWRKREYPLESHDIEALEKIASAM